MLPEFLDWGRDRNPGWHRRWILLLLTVGPLAFAAFCIVYFGADKGMGPATLFIGTAFLKGLEYAVARYKEGRNGGGNP